MIGRIQHSLLASRAWIWPVVAAVLLGAFVLGFRASRLLLALPVVGMGAVLLLRRPVLGLLALVVAALVVPLEFGTGSAVALNPATLLVPALLALWVVDMMGRREVHLAPSRTNTPLLLFLLAGLLSLLVGSALWDPFVPRDKDFIVVQLAQWAIFAFSAIAFWLTGNVVRDEVWLKRLTFLFLAVAGGLALLRVVPVTAGLAERTATLALSRAPFWLLLTALAGGQLMFNEKLSKGWRFFLPAVVGAALVLSLYFERSSGSYWVAVLAVLGVLAWLRFPRLRWPVLILLLLLTFGGLLTSAVYEFAGGDAEWYESGSSRLALIGRVVEVTLRNPVTGLGPAAYRAYARAQPLLIHQAYYIAPWVSSHNNYVDLFSHVGLIGLGLFFWFAVELALVGLRLRAHLTEGFAAGYVNGMLAAGVGALTVMMLADWILPFVYNIGFPGFQASVLVWLFLGGLVALEQMLPRPRDR